MKNILKLAILVFCVSTVLGIAAVASVFWLAHIKTTFLDILGIAMKGGLLISSYAFTEMKNKWIGILLAIATFYSLVYIYVKF